MTPPTDPRSDSRLEDQLATIRHYLEQALDAAEVRHARPPTALQSLLRLPPRDPAVLVKVARQIRDALKTVAPLEPLDPADPADPADRRLPAQSQPATTHRTHEGDTVADLKPKYPVQNPCPQIADHPILMDWLSLGEVCCGCSARPGREHAVWCDQARCLVTGQQREACRKGLGWHDEDPETHSCGDDMWPGFDREARDAINAGWFTTLGGTAPVERDHPGAIPDYTRLYRDAAWDRSTHTWRPKS
jgi:hypothetical protein